jgi:hypothetical protein
MRDEKIQNQLRSHLFLIIILREFVNCTKTVLQLSWYWPWRNGVNKTPSFAKGGTRTIAHLPIAFLEKAIAHPPANIDRITTFLSSSYFFYYF